MIDRVRIYERLTGNTKLLGSLFLFQRSHVSVTVAGDCRKNCFRLSMNLLMENLYKIKSISAEFQNFIIAHDMTKMKESDADHWYQMQNRKLYRNRVNGDMRWARGSQGMMKIVKLGKEINSHCHCQRHWLDLTWLESEVPYAAPSAHRQSSAIFNIRGYPNIIIWKSELC